MWPRPFRIATLVGVLLLLVVQVAGALSYYDPVPRGTVGLSRPVIAQQIVLGQGERITGAELWLNGQPVAVSWDAAGRVFYQPPQPLPAGVHQAKLVVRVAPARPGYFYAPITTEWSFTVAAGAVESLPPPGPEELRALAVVNRYRQVAGLPPLTYDERLAAAALNHARYLVANPEQIERDGHGEEPGRPHFTGARVGDRVRYLAYDGGSGEVINFVDRAEEAVEGWIDTLYHRIPLIHPGNAVMGYGLAGSLGKNVNIVLTGPAAPSPGQVLYPAPGQRAVPPSWDGHETPNPFDLYPGTPLPVGYPLTLTFGGRVSGLRLTSWSVTGPKGAVVALPFDPGNDPRLDDTVCLIPREPLEPLTTYTVRMQGQVNLGKGPESFDRTWSFTTGPEHRPQVRSRVVTTSQGGEIRSLRLEGIALASGLQIFLGGLPVQDLTWPAPNRAQFRPPLGLTRGQADLLLVTPGGLEEVWRDFFTGSESYTLPQTTGFTTRPVLVRGRRLEQPALIHSGGAVLLPVEALTQLGAVATPVPAIGRTYWRLGEQSGDYSLGRVSATVAGAPLRLAMPPRSQGSAVWVDAAFVRALGGVEGLLGGAEYYLGTPVLGIMDIEGHWAFVAVERLLRKEIVGGYGDGTFRPDATLSRAAFVKMLAAARGLPLRVGVSGGLTDVASHWVAAQGYLGAAVAAGIVVPGEYAGGRFEPDRAITREEIAVMVTRALGLEAKAATLQVPVVGGVATVAGRTFTDAASWRRPGHIATAVEAGIITGYAEADGRFTYRPDRQATRAEAAVMVVRTLDR